MTSLGRRLKRLEATVRSVSMLELSVEVGVTSLQRRLRKLEVEILDHAMMQDNDSQHADLSMYSIEELEGTPNSAPLHH